MVINWPFLIVGILCLWIPRRWMRMGRVVGMRKKKALKSDEPWRRRESGDPRVNFRQEFSKARNYVDLFRATAGGLAIVGWREIPESLSVGENAGARTAWIVLGLKLAILLVGVLVQVIRRENGRVTFFPAIFFLTGISVSLCEPWAALFAFILIWSINPMLRNAQIFLCTYALLVGGFGYLLAARPIWYPVAAGLLCFLPTLLSWMTRRALVIPSRKAVHTPAGES